jgi:putative ABC transport system substrate-binding protein
MKRREFITLLGGAAAGAPFPARAQQAAMPVVGFLHAGSPAPNADYVAAFRIGLSEAGFIEGQNLTIEFRWAAGQVDHLTELAADLVRRNVAVIATPLSTQAALAAKAATTTIPIVFGTGGNPVAIGLVASFSRPGGNVTGISIMSGELAPKRFGIMHELLPAAKRFAVLGNSHNALTEETLKGMQANADALGAHVEFLYAGTDIEIEEAFAAMVQNRTDVLLIAPDEFFTSHITQLVTLSQRHRLPSSYVVHDFPRAGGLTSYGPDFENAYREIGNYAGRVLKGEKPADLPVSQPTKFMMAINLKTAKTLGINISSGLLAIADEVIE